MNALTDCLIDGDWRPASGDTFQSLNPATGEEVWQGRAASDEDVVAAVAAARNAAPAWSRAPLSERIALAERYRDLVMERAGQLARLIASETGKPMWECQAEASAVAGKVDISIAAYAERTGERASATAFGEARLTHHPHGVMAVLGPYNFPAHLPNGHIVPALIAGNTAVFKPSEHTPAVGAFLVEVWRDAGLPDGVLNAVQGARATGGALLEADVNGVLFTGSVDAGVMIHRKFAGRPDVILALEMGGNNPLIAWDWADTDAAANIVLQSAFITSGQRCTCARRLIVPDDPAGEALLAALDHLLDRIRVGGPDDDPEPFMGPVINTRAAEAVIQAQAALGSKGGVVRRRASAKPDAAFVTPGVIDMTGCEPEDREVFGPLLQVFRVANADEAIARANATKFGLSAGVISDEAALWARAHAELRAGILNWNRPTTGAASNMPFGGPGFSGNHRPSAYYAADYCAYPVATQSAPKVEPIATRGLNDS